MKFQKSQQLNFSIFEPCSSTTDQRNQRPRRTTSETDRIRDDQFNVLRNGHRPQFPLTDNLMSLPCSLCEQNENQRERFVTSMSLQRLTWHSTHDWHCRSNHPSCQEVYLSGRWREWVWRRNWILGRRSCQGWVWALGEKGGYTRRKVFHRRYNQAKGKAGILKGKKSKKGKKGKGSFKGFSKKGNGKNKSDSSSSTGKESAAVASTASCDDNYTTGTRITDNGPFSQCMRALTMNMEWTDGRALTYPSVFQLAWWSQFFLSLNACFTTLATSRSTPSSSYSSDRHFCFTTVLQFVTIIRTANLLSMTNGILLNMIIADTTAKKQQRKKKEESDTTD